MEYISGVDRNQTILLPDCVDDYVDENNPVRVIDAYVNNLDMVMQGFTKSQPNGTGRPPYSPKDMLKLYMYGYMNRVRSSRRLETESKRNLEVIWLLGKLSPDHKTIARFRQENPVALKNVFRDFVRLCVNLGLYGNELLAIDGSKFKACNSKDRNFTQKKLVQRIARLDKKIEEYVQQMDALDFEEDRAVANQTREKVAQIIAGLTQHKSNYEGYSREIYEKGETQKSLTDPDSRLMISNGKTEVCFNVQTAVDSKNKMIAEFEVVNHAQDKNQMGPLARQAAQALGVEKVNVVADAGYDSASDIAECISDGITPHVAGCDIDICIPTSEAKAQTITSYTNGRCVYIRSRNLAICPMGKLLYPGIYKRQKMIALFYNTKECARCTQRCTTSRFKSFEITMPAWEFHKDYEDENLWIRQLRVRADREVVKQRKCIVEHPFGTAKRAMDTNYCLMKGIPNVRGEFSLTFLAYNMKRALKILGTTKLLQSIGV